MLLAEAEGITPLQLSALTAEISTLSKALINHCIGDAVSE